MKLFSSDGPAAPEARPVDERGARMAWAKLRGRRGEFLGLIDDAGRTVQFYFDASVPPDCDDERTLAIVLVDLPTREGTHGRTVTVGEVDAWIRRAFAVGADPVALGPLAFTPHPPRR